MENSLTQYVRVHTHTGNRVHNTTYTDADAPKQRYNRIIYMCILTQPNPYFNGPMYSLKSDHMPLQSTNTNANRHHLLGKGTQFSVPNIITEMLAKNKWLKMTI